MLEKYKDGKEYGFASDEAEGILRWDGSIGFWEVVYSNYKGNLNEFHWLAKKGRIVDYEAQRQGTAKDVAWRVYFLTDNRAIIASLLGLNANIDQRESWWGKKIGNGLAYLFKDPYERILDGQIEKLLTLGYHRVIGLTEEHFLQRLNIPSLYHQIRQQIAIEKKYGLGRRLNCLLRSMDECDFTDATIYNRPLIGDVPLLLVIHDCLVPFEVQAALAGIEVSGRMQLWELSRFATSPPFAHLLFDVNDGGNMSHTPFNAACVLRQMGRRGLTTEEGIAFVTQYPEKLTKFLEPSQKGQQLYLTDRLAGEERGALELSITTCKGRARLSIVSLCVGGEHQKVPSCRGKSPIFPRDSYYCRCRECKAIPFCKDKVKITPPRFNE